MPFPVSLDTLAAAAALDPLPPITPLLHSHAGAAEMERAISSALNGTVDAEPMAQPSLSAVREARRSASGSFGALLPKGCSQIDFNADEAVGNPREKFLGDGGEGEDKSGSWSVFAPKVVDIPLADRAGDYDAWQYDAEDIGGSEGEVSSCSKSTKGAGGAVNPDAQSTGWGTGVGARTRTLAEDSERRATETFPLKRGRKRKNPGLTDEERKAIRQAQNRENAKQSRLRRINLTEEYRKKAEVLQEENKKLKVSVATLEERLKYLQGMITVSVRAG